MQHKTIWSVLNPRECPMSTVMVAPRYSGKTFLLVHMLNDKTVNTLFDLIIVFSPTATLDEQWQQLRNKEVVLLDEFKEDYLSNLLDNIKEDASNGLPKQKILLILDDLADVYRQDKKSLLNTLAIKGRHYGISYILTSQKYKLLPHTIRTNSRQKLFFKVNNKSEMTAIVQEQSTRETNEDDLRDMLDTHTKDYGYLLIIEGNTRHYYAGKGLKLASTTGCEESSPS